MHLYVCTVGMLVIILLFIISLHHFNILCGSHTVHILNISCSQNSSICLPKVIDMLVLCLFTSIEGILLIQIIFVNVWGKSEFQAEECCCSCLY